MSMNISKLRLCVESSLVTSSSPNFHPSTWPPADDFPIVIDKHSNIVSRYGDAIWNFSPWCGQSLAIRFDAQSRGHRSVVSSHNARLLRQLAAWLLFAGRGVKNARTIHQAIQRLRPIFVLCSQEGILASELSLFPAVADQIARLISPSSADVLFTQLHLIFEGRNEIGFMLLDREGLRRLAAALPSYDRQQTPYIPPRIWTYQLVRLREFLDDFHTHRKQIEECFRFCLDSYAKNCGSLTQACATRKTIRRSPFDADTRRVKSATYVGTFSDVVRRFGMEALLKRWYLPPEKSLDRLKVSDLSAYFNDVSWVSLAYIINFSMMRISEAASLRAGCLQIEQDDSFGPVYLLRGVTAKTVEDDDARWVTSPSVKVAVDAATAIAQMRLQAAKGYPGVLDDSEKQRPPILLQRAYEPWANSAARAPVGMTSHPQSYFALKAGCPNLFNEDSLRITAEDLEIARLITPNLDGEKFQVGKIWPLAWHQLRRTGMVNMQASGIVSDASAQYQAKHATRAMTLYYGQGYSQVPLNECTRREYIRTMYEMMGKEIDRLFTDRFVSPYGPMRKAEVLRLVDPKDLKNLIAAGKSGRVACRQTLLGMCTSRSPCEYGGIDNIIRCVGGDGRGACNDLLLDRDQRSSIFRLIETLDARLASTPDGSPLHNSLNAQKCAAENALGILDEE